MHLPSLTATPLIGAGILCLIAAACSGSSVTPTATDTAEPSITAGAAVVAVTSPTLVVPPRSPSASPAVAPPPVSRARHIVAVDAGHGGPRNVGAAHTNAQRKTDLIEKDLDLDIARRIQRLLVGDGYDAPMIRDGDYALTAFDGPDFNENVRLESAARAAKANATGADIMLVIHHNGSEDPQQSGTEVYYNPDRSFGGDNRRLAVALHDAIIASLRTLPYDVSDRGIKNDAPIGARFGQPHTFLLGDGAGFPPTKMPAALVEGLFVSNDREAAMLQREDVREAIARGYERGVRAYFGD